MITINELFSGIGAQVAALKRLGIPYKVVGVSEIDKYAIQSYEAINGQTRNYGDIYQISALDYADMWTYSFPCQDLSFAGKQAGINENTRSGLLLHVERLLKRSVNDRKQPKYLLLENVKALVSKKFKPDFDKWLNTLEELGYNNYWKVLNAKDYGIPQNRERVFVVSIRKDVDIKGYEFPSSIKLEKRLKDMLEHCVDEKYYLSDERVGKIVENLKNKEISNTTPKRTEYGKAIRKKYESGEIKESRHKMTSLEPREDGITNTITTVQKDNLLMIQNQHGFNKGGVHEMAPILTSGGNYKENNFVVEPSIKVLGNYKPSNHECGRIMDVGGISPTIKENHGAVCAIAEPKIIEEGVGHHPLSKKFEFDGFHEKECPTLLATDYKCPKCYSNGYRIRKLTPKECWRLMGFTDDEFEKAKSSGVSNTQLYKQAGNSIVVDVLVGIFKNLF